MRIFLLMILLHILDDFVLQGVCLNKLKQKEFWKDYISETNKLYKYDYIMALFIHSLSWSLMIHLPLFLTNVSNVFLLISILINAIIHSIVDDLKANKKKINLITDQIIHFIQIIAVFFILYFFIKK